jgi:hypothetical protein
MKKSARKGVLLFASMMALAAIAMPAAASAVVWGPVNTTTALDGQLKVTYTNQNWWFTCNTHLGVKTRTPASSTLDVNSATFSSCAGGGIASGCGFTLTAASLPWTMNAVSLSGVGLTVANVNVAFGGGGCGLGSSGSLVLSGTITSGVWNATNHSVTYTNATGFMYSIGGGVYAPVGTLKADGTLVNTTHVLTLA